MARPLALLGGERAVTIPWPVWPEILEEDVQAVTDVLRGGKLSMLRKEGIVSDFEEAFAEWSRTQCALAFSSGTAALHAACFACGAGPGWEVLTPSYTWISAITAILHANATPVFCDVAPDSFHIAPDEIRRRATARTKAVIVCHTWGLPAPMDQILRAARDCSLSVIEDASHAHGGRFNGDLVGTIGDVGCFSMQGSKALVAGEGGVLVTDDRRVYERALIPGHHGERLKQCLSEPDLLPFAAAGGYWKYRAAPLHMALAHSQLTRLDAWNAAKQRNYDRLESLLEDVPFLRFPRLPPGSTRGFYGSPCLYEYDQDRVSRATFLEALAAEGAIVFPGYDVNWYCAPILQDENLFRQFWVGRHANGAEFLPPAPGELPHTDRLVANTLVLPSWGRDVPELVDQYAAAFFKVSRQMDVLEVRQRSCERNAPS